MNNTFKEKTKKHINNQNIFTKLEKYVFLIEEKNKVINLTGFTGDKLWEQGIYESIILLEMSFNNNEGNILDIGAGAGFPSVPYLIAHPEKKLTIYEPIGKRVDFLNEVSKKLDLDIDVQKIRVEDSKEYEKFDFICARAVVEFKILLEISHHIAKIGADFAFIKGKKAKKEIHEARFQIKNFNVNPKIKKSIINQKENNIIFYKKENKTPKNFPRKWSVIKKA
ncbi:MAG: 16S rRNA (guanine(527)-N(7))-methyltransferase RsmG [Mycoplasma sp.]|nr:16S rRNA (guanine(527)-N(7))-methyltransferase RsmG [Mycoplasma sp.]